MRSFLSDLTSLSLAHVAAWMVLVALVVLAITMLASRSSRRVASQSLEALRMDVRSALHSMARQKGVTGMTLASLAVGIGACVLVFSTVDVCLLRPLPYNDAHRLVDVGGTLPERGWQFTTQSLPDILDLREQSQTLNVAGHYGMTFNLSGGSRPERVEGNRVSWNFFQVLEVQPMLGRSFHPEEELADQSNVALITSGLWQRLFAADQEVVGRSLLLDKQAYTIIGVLPSSFWFDGRSTDVWTPLGIKGDEHRSQREMESLGRLKTGFTVEQARAEVEEIARGLEQEYPDTNQGWHATVRPLRDRFFGEVLRRGSLIASVAAAFVLLIACANAANLQLSRAADRTREVAVRSALGASRWSLTRQFLTEALVMAGIAGVLGSALSWTAVQGLTSFLPRWSPRLDAVTVDGRALLFAVIATAAAGLIFGTLPAWRSARSDLAPALGSAGRGAVAPATGLLGRALVVGEVSAALVLLVCSALLVQGFLQLQRTDWGWSPENVLTFKVALPESTYDTDESVLKFYEQLGADLRSLPGVSDVGGTEILPLEGASSTFYNAVGQEVARAERPSVEIRIIIPGYFQAMAIQLVRGRLLTDDDKAEIHPVLVVNETLADRHWPDGDAVGQRLQFAWEEYEIVGVVRNTLDLAPDIRRMAFLPTADIPLHAMSMVVNSTVEPTSVADAVRTTVANLDPDLPVYDLMTMTEVMAEENSEYSVMPGLMAGLAAVGLLLGLIGVYGVIARSVARRTQELGIRMAIGARRINVLTMVVRQGLALMGTGVVLGLGLSALATRSLALFLFGMSPFHAPTFVLVALVLLAAGLAATLVPARRATRIDPIQALGFE